MGVVCAGYGSLTLAAWGEQWLVAYVDARLAPATARAYRFHWYRRIVPSLGERTLAELEDQPLFIDELRLELAAADVGASSIRHALAVLSSALTRAQRMGLIDRNPVPLVGNPPPRRVRRAMPLGPAEVEALRGELEPRDAALVSVLALAGLRPGEALALRWSDVRERTLAVEESVSFGAPRTTKTGRSRYVPLMAPLAEDLASFRVRGAREASLVFPGAVGEVWSDTAYRNWRTRRFRPAARLAGLPDATPYTLRASFASLQLHAGRPVLEVAQMLGHSPQVLLDHYAGLIAELVGADPVPAEEAVRAARARRA